MPGDRLAFAIRVGREQDLVGVLGRSGDGVDVLLVALDQRVAHAEVVVGIDRAFLGFEVANVAVGGEDLEVACPGISSEFSPWKAIPQ